MKIKEIVSDSSKIRHYTGLSIKKFNILVNKITILKKRHCSIIPLKNKPGAGRPGDLTMAEQIAVVLIYYRIYCSQAILAAMANIDQSNISRIISKIESFIEQAADPELSQTLNNIEKNKGSINSLCREALSKNYPDFDRVLTDATEVQIQRPGKNNELRKLYYSGKNKDFTIKVQVSVSKDQKFLHVTKAYPGSMHDKTIMDHEKTIAQLPKKSHQILDSGYQGAVAEYPDYYVNTPIKKTKNGELFQLDKEYNSNLAKRRVCVENALVRPKNSPYVHKSIGE